MELATSTYRVKEDRRNPDTNIVADSRRSVNVVALFLPVQRERKSLELGNNCRASSTCERIPRIFVANRAHTQRVQVVDTIEGRSQEEFHLSAFLGDNVRTSANYAANVQ